MAPTQRHDQRDGITIEDRWANRGRSGKRWLARVRDTRLQRYKSKAFAELDAAKAWANHTRARFELSEASAGSWPLAEVVKECVANMRREGKAGQYIKAVERHGLMLQGVGVRDLAEDSFQAKLRTYLHLPTDEGHRRSDGSAPAASTVQVRFIYIRVLITFAQRYQGLRVDPLVGFPSPGSTGRNAITRTADQESYDLAEIRAVIALDLRKDPMWLAFVLAVFTGLRSHEVCALNWSDIDWTHRLLHVVKGKGAKSRHIPVQLELYDFLHALGGPGATSPRLGKLLPDGERSGRIRLNVKYLRPLLDLAGVKWDLGPDAITGIHRRKTWHGLRRAHAAASLAAGVDGVQLQASLGHEEISQTAAYSGTYARWTSAVNAEGWPRGRLCLFPPHSKAGDTAVRSAT